MFAVELACGAGTVSSATARTVHTDSIPRDAATNTKAEAAECFRRPPGTAGNAWFSIIVLVLRRRASKAHGITDSGGAIGGKSVAGSQKAGSIAPVRLR